ncbi:hypothetical protein GCM10009811_22940 [Nostocoides veronense]|uniref:Sigma-70 family RNA polymerase sigma factor n=2 Tax=Nostocoides veronense TaxID=330836 RepID=A0ABP4XY96_9MICO
MTTMTTHTRPGDDESTEPSWHLQRAMLATPEYYPAMNNLSAGHLFNATLRATAPDPLEYVTVTNRSLEDIGALGLWNMHWEAAQYRRYLFDEDELPGWMSKLADQGERNICFIPRTTTRYYELAPLFHLLSKDTLLRHGLPVMTQGVWPLLAPLGDVDSVLPLDAQDRLAKAWAHTIWRHLMPGSRMLGFTRDDPIRLLAHNLDYWIPPVTEVLQARLRQLPHSSAYEPLDEPAVLMDGSTLEGARLVRPRMGSYLWQGEQEAAQATQEVIDAADGTGNLRGILDAVRSHRIQDDFSNHWTYAKEDFERKLHRKRSKVKVTFVELKDGPPVHSPETEVIGDIVCNDFLALLDPQDRRIVVLLSSGVTKLTDVAATLGYANHSPVSKRLAKIRKLAERHLA